MPITCKQKAILVECLVPGYTSRIEEVRSIMETMEYDVVQSIFQKRGDYEPGLCIGRGKVDEISELVRERGISAVVFGNTLTGGQVLRIQERMGDAKVLDRNLAILELFDKRAMTQEAKLQIALARLLYTYGWGREAIRRRGIEREQVGTGGPGAYPFLALQADARRRASKLRATLRKVRKQKEMLRARRRKLGFPVVAVAGYTQSGKTTFFNRTVSEAKEVGRGPFTTLSTSARRLRLQSERDIILVDAIGFVDNMHPLILDAFETTLMEVSNSDLILLFVDISDDEATIKKKILASKGIIRRVAPSKPLIICANKIDLVTDGEELDGHLNAVRGNFEAPVIPLSAKTGKNINSLLDLMDELLGSRGMNSAAVENA